MQSTSDSNQRQARTIGRFQDQITVITGGAAGIGGATSAAFAAAGARVVILDINADVCRTAVEDVRSRGYLAEGLAVDVSDREACENSVGSVARRYGRIDVLVNSAGITRRTNVVDTTVDDWERVLNVNLRSVFLMCKYVIPIMRRQRSGKIVNVASGWGLVGGEKAAAYCASKGGVILLTKAMALDHGPEGITVNCVCPGDTDTQLLVDESRQLGLPDHALIEQGAKRPLGRVGKPEEIAASILYLASADASFVTGAALVVDGGGLAGSM